MKKVRKKRVNPVTASIGSIIRFTEWDTFPKSDSVCGIILSHKHTETAVMWINESGTQMISHYNSSFGHPYGYKHYWYKL